MISPQNKPSEAIHFSDVKQLSSIRTMSTWGIALLFALVFFLMAVAAWISDESDEAARWVAHTHEHHRKLQQVLSVLQDAETGQRGYLLTQDESYLEPYNSARLQVTGALSQLQSVTSDNLFQQENIEKLKSLVTGKLNELGETIELQRQGQGQQALVIVKSDKGKVIMDRIRSVIKSMELAETALLEERQRYFVQTKRVSLLAEIAGFILIGGVALTVLIQTRRSLRSRQLAESQLVDSDERTRLILDAAGQGIYGLDLNGYTTFVNRKVCDLLGYTAEELVNHQMHTLVQHSYSDGSTYPAEESAILTALDAGTVLEVANEVLYRKDGTSFPVDYVSTPIYRMGEKVGAVVVFSDTTERKRLEEQLRRSQKLEAVGQLSGGIAHDFNNLLGVIMGNADMLAVTLETGNDPLKFVNGIVEAGEKAASLTQRLLAFSRQQPLAEAPTDLPVILRSMEDMLTRTLGATVDLSIDCLGDSAPVMVDANQFENAILNLALNARDAMPSGGSLSIQTKLKVLDETYTQSYEDLKPGEYVEVVFSDTGSGMNPDTIARAFEPFYTTKGIGEGSGLGLSMVYGFVKQSDGHIAISSEPGRGTTVRFYLPRSHEAAETSSKIEVVSQQPRAKGRILVVEDEPRLLDTSAGILVNAGYEVIEAGDGATALHHLEDAQRFDLLFTDLILPGGMTGQDIAQRAKELHADIKVIYTTGFADATRVNAGRLDPGVSILHKPFRRAELLERVTLILSDGVSAA